MPNALRDKLRSVGNALGQTRPNNGVRAFRDIGSWLTGPVAKDDMYSQPIPGDTSSLSSIINSLIPHPGQSEEEIIAGTTGIMLPGGGVKAARELARGPVPESVLNAIGWHGSPHKFAPTPKNALGEFDSSKIGTGEGAQAYGHGLYFAENPQVAKDYAEQPILWDRGDGVRRWISQAGKGNLYKAEIPDEYVNKMLDWDKPLGEQRVPVDPFIQAQRNAIEAIPSRFSPATIDDATARALAADKTGGQLYDMLVKEHGPEKASMILKEAGIPGIRYLDQGSRGAGQGTSNYVVFDPSITNILGKE